MEDGQEAGTYASDRAEEDPADFEYNGEIPSAESGDDDEDDGESSGESSDSMDADDADVGAADPPRTDVRPPAQGGTPDPSLEQFLAEWSDDDSISKADGPDAAPRAKPPKVPAKRTSTTSSSAGMAPGKVAKAMPIASKGKHAQETTAQRPTAQAPLNVAPLRCRMPSGAPRTIGYAFVFTPSISLSFLMLTLLLFLFQGAHWS